MSVPIQPNVRPASPVPEIGPYLGVLVDVGRRFADPEVGLDQVRLSLVTQLFERVAEARRLGAMGDWPGAHQALRPEVWLELWRQAAIDATRRVVETIKARIGRAARGVGYPKRLLAKATIGPGVFDMVQAAFVACGIPLENRLARGFPEGERWWEAVRQAAVSLEDSWQQLEVEARRQLAASEETIAAVEAWRPARWPWLVLLLAVTGFATWLGLAIGGAVPRPGVLDPLATWFWSL